MVIKEVYFHCIRAYFSDVTVVHDTYKCVMNVAMTNDSDSNAQSMYRLARAYDLTFM